MYYCHSRYYYPEICRWISGDSEQYLDDSTFVGLNLFTYCLNDPIDFSDSTGHWVDTVIDLVFLFIGIADYLNDPSEEKAVWLCVDMFLTAIPYVPAVSGLRHFSKIDNVIDSTKVFGKIDNAIDGTNALNKIDNVGNIVSNINYSGDAQEIGTYLLKDAKGNVIYVGKGSRKRMEHNFLRYQASSKLYYPAKNIEMAFANEAYFMSVYGGAQSMMKNYKLLGGYEKTLKYKLLNKINSPGLKYLFYWF